MRDILTNWPGSRPTSEMDYETRHRRLVEMIAGYPEVVTGMRPLDIPTHLRSIDALKLSLYLDGIPNKFAKDSEWSSLRTTLLDWDLLEPGLHKKEEKKGDRHISLHRTFIGCLIHHIEFFEEVNAMSEEEKNVYNLDKSNFQRALHSSHNSRDGCWPGDAELRKKPGTFDFAMNNFILLGQNDNQLDAVDGGENTNDLSDKGFYEHSVKFEQIQSWIKWYCDQPSDLSPLRPNIRQNMHLGASAILEGVFARIRSKLLADRRPGAITVDGGGRICFISTKNPDEEKTWIEDRIVESLDLDAAHLHPYNQVIIDSIKKWGMLTNQAYLIDRSGIKLYWKDDNNAFLEADQGKKAFWRGFLTEQLHCITKMYYPKANQNNDENDTSTEKKPPFSSYRNMKCKFCTGINPEEEKVSSPRKLLETCEMNAEGIKEQVCVFHHVMFYLGNAVKIRQQSQHSKSVFVKGRHKIHHVIHLDGNGIGQIFTQDYKHIDPPSYNAADPNKTNFENLMLPFWNRNYEAIIDLKKPWENVERLFESQFRERLIEHPKIFIRLRKRRVQSYLQRKRRSFDFNAKWWISFREGVYSNPNNHLEPWVAAGDDLILINRKTDNYVAVVDTLRTFHNLLMDYFDGNVPISFGAGISKSVSNDLSVTIKHSKYAEESAKHSWKDRVLEMDDQSWLVSEKARIAHKEGNEIPLETFPEYPLESESSVPSIVHVWVGSEQCI